MVYHYKGNDGDRTNSGMAHFNDLREIYARQMEYHGCGFGLFQPISSQDMTPPCAGYFDRNGDWNLICNLSTSPQAQRPLHLPGDAPAQPYAPLKYEPNQSSALNIEWQPKTSQDVEAHVLSGGGQTPDNLPAGADVQIKYASKSKFGAVLMTLRPITLTAYNDERLFMDWLNNNRALLYSSYGAELKKYGLWVVTRTFTAPGCSINAWQDNSKESTVSLKAKASMMGELADGEMQWNDKMTDKDWCHYKAKDGDGLVVFMDGIEVQKTEWWIEGMRQKLTRRPSPPSRSHSNSPDRLMYYDPSTVLPPQGVGEVITVPKRRSPLGLGGYLAPPTRAGGTPYDYLTQDAGNNAATYDSTGNGLAHADIGVMPTWSENTAGPNTHGGTQNIVPRQDASGGYLVMNPKQKTQADRQDSGFGSVFTKMTAPNPWAGIDSPVIGRKGTDNADTAKAAPAATAPPASATIPPAPAPPATAPPAAQSAPAAAPSTPAPKNSPPQAAAARTPSLVPAPSPAPPSTNPATPELPQADATSAWRFSGNGWTIDFHAPVSDEQTLKDAGVTQLSRRSLSIRRPSDFSIRRISDASSVGRPGSIAESVRSGLGVGRAKSLRRETRSISGSVKDDEEEKVDDANEIAPAEVSKSDRRKSMAV